MKLKKLLAVVLCITMVLSTIGTVAFAEDATSETVTPCYTNANSFWGEAQTYSTESLVIEIYEDETKIASASLNNVDGIIDGDVFVTWHINFGENNDEYWNVEWAEGYPKYDMNPTAVTLFADGVEVAENDVRFNGPDDLNKIVAFAEGNTGGVKAYTTLGEAIGKFNGRKVNVVRDVNESIDGFYGCTLTTNVEGGVTITDTNTSDWIDFDDVTVGKGVTVDIELPFSGDSENVILGTLVAGDTYYHGYDAKTTIKDGGKIIVEGTTILRYNEESDSGIYIYGDNDASTVEFDCGYYIGAYSGTFYVENANVNAGYFLLKNSYDNDDYANIGLTLDNSSITVVGTDDTQDSFIIDDKAAVTLKNGSVIDDVRDFNILEGTNLTLAIDSESSIKATNISVSKDVPFETVDNGDGTFGVAEIPPVEVTTYEELLAALAADDVFVINMMNDITGEATQSNGYGKTGINILNGETLNGNGYTLTLSGLNGTWDSAISTTGGTIKNLTINNGFRGVFVNHNSDYSAPVVLENVVIDGPVYTVSCDQGTNNGLIATNCTFNGWTSYAKTLGNASFTKCTFGEGSGYAFCRPYKASEFNDCDFEAGYEFDATRADSLEFNECRYDGAPLNLTNSTDMFYNGGSVMIDGEENNFVKDPVAYVGSSAYAKLQDAVDAVNGNGTVTLLNNVNESVTVKASDIATYSTEGVTIEMDGFTLTGNIVVEAGATARIKNGSIVNEDSGVSAIQSFGTTTIETVDVTSARHGVRVEGGVTTINSGSYKVNNTDGKTVHAVNVSDGGKVVINDGTFIGPKGTAADSGTAVNVQADSTVEIYNGKFSGGKTNTLASKGTLAVSGGLFDQSPSAFAADGYEAVETGEDTYLYAVEPLDAQGVKVEFAPTVEKNVYDIVLKSTSYQNIYEFVAAEFKFINDSTTVGDKEMSYEILGIKDKTVVEQAADNEYDNDQYIIRIPAGETENRLTGKEITIGQVKFIGQATSQFQGNIKFGIEKGEVDATERNTHLGYYYSTTDGTLTVVTVDDTDYVIDSTVSEIKRKVAVNVAFNHNIDTNDYWEGRQITATIKNNFGYEETQEIEISAINAGATTFVNVPLGQITVTLKAPGFRTYTYKTVVEETADNGVLVLNFWNDVKRNDDEVIESGKTEMAHNFLVGDIVMDMTVDKYDLAAVTSYYGTYGIDKAEAEKYIKYDLNRDGDIDIRDVQYVLHTMGN